MDCRLGQEEAEARREREQKRRAQEAEAKRVRDLEAFASREAETWAEVESLIGQMQPKPYDEAVALLTGETSRYFLGLFGYKPQLSCSRGLLFCADPLFSSSAANGISSLTNITVSVILSPTIEMGLAQLFAGFLEVG